MINCPNCKEIIGDNVTKCPFCDYVFPEEEIKKIERKQQLEKVGINMHMEEIRKKAAEKRRRYGLFLFIYVTGLLVLAFILFSVTKNMTLLGVMVGADLVGEILIIAIGYVKGAFRCPYCDSFLMRNYGNFCSRCGKRIF